MVMAMVIAGATALAAGPLAPCVQRTTTANRLTLVSQRLSLGKRVSREWRQCLAGEQGERPLEEEAGLVLPPSWLLAVLGRGEGEEDDGEERQGAAGMEPWEGKAGREEASWCFEPDLPRGLLGRQFGGVAMASGVLGLGLAMLVVPSAHAVEMVVRERVGMESDMQALAFGPDGPLVEEFWDNMRRYGFYFLTVASGGLYSLLKPLVDLLKSPVTAVLVVAVLGGSLYLVYLTLSSMLGITEFDYAYSS